jgi:hypothetical protein
MNAIKYNKNMKVMNEFLNIISNYRCDNNEEAGTSTLIGSIKV